MLTAIGQFVTDSFHTEASESLDAIKVGEFRVWIERGPRAVLAATIRGMPPTEFRTVMQDTLDGIHVLQQRAFDNFKGDTSAFRACRPDLEACLRSESSEPPTKVNIADYSGRPPPSCWPWRACGLWRWWGETQQPCGARALCSITSPA